MFITHILITIDLLDLQFEPRSIKEWGVVLCSNSGQNLRAMFDSSKRS